MFDLHKSHAAVMGQSISPLMACMLQARQHVVCSVGLYHQPDLLGILQPLLCLVSPVFGL